MAPQSKITNLYERVHECVIDSTAASLPPGTDLSRVVVEPPRDPTHGDWATNAAMVTAKGVGKKPKEIAEATANALRNAEIVDRVDVAGPGFINLRLKPHVWGEELRVVLESGLNYGRSDIGRSQKVNVEFVSTTSTMRARRSTSWRARPFCVTAKRSARTSVRSRRDFTPAIT